MIRPPQAAPDTGVRRVPGNGSPTLQQSAPAQTAPQVAPQPIARDATKSSGIPIARLNGKVTPSAMVK